VWKNRRRLLPPLLAAVVVSFVMVFVGPADHWLNTTGLLLDIAGLVQLEVSGVFERIIEIYGDEERYPGGPPSNITREIIDNPDTPIRTGLRNSLFFDGATGLWFIFFGQVPQLAAVWAA
jgi:hypothetical protein